jgi:hypothetical protein
MVPPRRPGRIDSGVARRGLSCRSQAALQLMGLAAGEHRLATARGRRKARRDVSEPAGQRRIAAVAVQRVVSVVEREDGAGVVVRKRRVECAGARARNLGRGGRVG